MSVDKKNKKQKKKLKLIDIKENEFKEKQHLQKGVKRNIEEEESKQSSKSR